MGFNWVDFKKSIEVPKHDDSHYENTTWCNRDLIPIPPARRTFGVWSYFGYWTVSGSCISAWSVGSTLLAYGLSPQQAIGVVIIGGVLTGVLAVACGWLGEVHHIGFTVSSRSAWGMRGAYFPVIIRIFVSCMWFGMQAYWGGQATRVMIGAIIPGFAHMKNSFSASSHLATNDFIGLVIWMAAFIPAILIKPERLQIPFFFCFVLFLGTCIGCLAWSTSHAGGAGSLFHEPGTAENKGWAFMFGITAILGSWGAGTLGQSDWTRYANRRYAPTVSQMIASPVTIAVTATIGIIVTSAAHDILGGDLVWNPIYLLADIQELYHSSPRARAGVFFASLGCVASQMSISVVLNSVSTGMDMAGLSPKYINIIRGSYIMAIIGIATQPWQLISTATKFVSVLSGFGVFMAPATGILLADYLVIRKRKLRLNELYMGNSSSSYWFVAGFNWRAFASFFCGVWPLLRESRTTIVLLLLSFHRNNRTDESAGLAATVNGYTDPKWTNWTRLYNLTFIVGLSISFVLFCALSYLFPMPGLGVDMPFVDEMEFVDGQSSPVDGSVAEKADQPKLEV
ncbi:nucleobase:cation symporter-1, NCS1 family [Sporothrix schenckii 1099-18]|uniref:Nucleobase:cation symporter-1, NCS1 family n=1 Tax=Sporothrix schenckii 1099-18 TaxID=1397361 RepID=A0A0F2MFL7_SPOSC|nr:nucleobase:cation symporter-1, NCS1 family [Sporothrix schenckii 1099-18]KJR88478.1 nucleobase:cation symporter-1, NCS1 family [Sporothrix schenckii 1099-18]